VNRRGVGSVRFLLGGLIGRARIPIWLFALVLLSGCGAVYHPGDVRDDKSAQIPFVEIELTPETVSRANLVTYSPKRLPGVFYGGSGRANQPSSPPPPTYLAPRSTGMPLRRLHFSPRRLSQRSIRRCERRLTR